MNHSARARALEESAFTHAYDARGRSVSSFAAPRLNTAIKAQAAVIIK